MPMPPAISTSSETHPIPAINESSHSSKNTLGRLFNHCPDHPDHLEDPPIYRLYFADELGTPGTVMTTFPMRRTGIRGRKGAGQFTAISYSVPKDSRAFWREHLTRREVRILGERERFGQRYLAFEHPDCGIEFEVVEDASDGRTPWTSPYVPAEHAAGGFYNWTASVREFEDMDIFMGTAWNFERIGTDGRFTRYEVNGGGAGRIIDLLHEPDAARAAGRSARARSTMALSRFPTSIHRRR
jgi:2,6-dichloro-p-hydroquinone 1,2-dioxygenase